MGRVGSGAYPFGEDAIGYIIYSESGVMAVQITRRGRPTVGPNPVVEQIVSAQRRLAELQQALHAAYERWQALEALQ